MYACDACFIGTWSPKKAAILEALRLALPMITIRICECASVAELVERIQYFLAHDDERQQIAAAGRARAITSGYAVDFRAAAILAKLPQLRSGEG